MISVPRWRTEASKRCRSFWRHVFLISVFAVEYSFVPAPPWEMLISSTYSINSTASFFPIYSCSVPPNWFVILYFPSENAPAPPKPFMIPQLLQCIHAFTFFPSIGHFLFSRLLPASNTAILNSGFSFTSSYAEKMPPGPDPIIITSKSIVPSPFYFTKHIYHSYGSRPSFSQYIHRMTRSPHQIQPFASRKMVFQKIFKFLLIQCI